MKCQNCGKTWGCGCNKRTAKDGKSCCAKCVHKYNAELDKKKNPSILK